MPIQQQQQQQQQFNQMLTLNQKKVIKLTAAELMSMIHQNVPSSMPLKTNILPLTQANPCGLFNTRAVNESKLINIDNSLNLDYDDIQSFNFLDDKLDYLLEDLDNIEFQINDNINDNNTYSNMENKTCFSNNQYDLDFDSSKIDTMCMQLLNSANSPAEETNQSLEECEFFENLLLEPAILEKTTLPSQPIVKENVMLDHDYSSKRKSDISFDDEESSFTQDSFGSSMLTPSSSVFTPTSSPSKKKRTRGIYRADDIKTQDDLTNYLERRKKNNISSKVSRANKKSYYNEMEARSNFLTEQNKKLQDKSKLLEQVNKAIKEYLIEQFNSK
jgi:hypothetical protein